MADKVAGLVIKVESKGVKTASDRLDLLSKRGKEADGVLRKLTQAADMANGRFATLDTSLRATLEGMRGLNRSASTVNISLRKATKSGEQSAAALGRVALQGGAAANVLGRTNNAASHAARSSAALRRGADGAAAGLRKTDKAAAGASRSVRGLGRNVDVSSKALAGIIKRSIAASAVFIAFQKLKAGASAVFDITSQFQRLDKQLTFVTGSASNAAEAMEFLRNEASRTGQSLLDIAPQYAKLEFAMKQAGLTADDTKNLFKATGSAAATFGLAQSDVNGVFRAFVQVASKGKVQAEELRGQIGERLPGAFGLAAKSMGVTVQELSLMLERGDVLAKDLLPRLAKEMKRTFGGDIEDKTDTLTANVGRIKTAVQELTQALAEQYNITNLIASGLEEATSVVKALGDDNGKTAAGFALRGRDALIEAVNTGEITQKELRKGLRFLLDQGFELEKKKNSFLSGAFRGIGPELREVGEAFGVEFEGVEKSLTKVLSAFGVADEVLQKFEGFANFGLKANGITLGEFQFSDREIRNKISNFKLPDFDLGIDPQALGIETAFDAAKRTFDERISRFDFSITPTFNFDDTAGLERAIAEAQSILDEVGQVASASSTIGPLFSDEDIKDYTSVVDGLIGEDKKLAASFKRTRELIVMFNTDAHGKLTQEGRDFLIEAQIRYDEELKAWVRKEQQKKIKSSETATAVLNITQGLEDGLVNAAREGKLAWGDMADFMVAEIQRVLIRTLLLKPLYSSLGLAFSGLGFGGAAAGFNEAALSINDHGGYIPSGREGIAGENGPEIITGPAVVTSTRTTADKMKSEMSGGYQRGNIYNITMGGGVSPQEFQQLKSIIAQQDRNFEIRAFNAVQDRVNRNPNALAR